MASPVVRLSQQELDGLIEKEARARLGMSGARFKTLWSQGKLRNSVAARDIAMLLRLEKGQRKNVNGQR
jgi:hypothetical protein